MTKAECFLLVILLNLMGLVVFFICKDMEWRSKTHHEIECLQIKIEMLEEKQKEKDKRQDDLIGAIIRTEAMAGTFDKK